MLRYLLGGFAAICLFMIAKSVIEHAPQPAAAGFADGQQNVSAVVAPTASATIASLSTASATPNPLVLTEASSNATHSSALTALANDQATQDTGTRIASTQTPAYWTADANAIAKQQAEAARNKTLLEAQLLAGTITAAPTSEWKTEVAYFPTMKAEQAKAKAQATIDERERVQAAEIDDATHKATLALIIVGTIIILGGLAWVVVALSWRVQGVSGGQAQASVESARIIPGKKDNKPRELVADDERAKLIEFVEACRRISGDGSTMITPQSEFGSDAGWDGFVKELKWLGLVKTKPGNEGGTRIAGGRTLAQLAQVLREGTNE